MSRTISLYEQLSEFWTDSIKLKKRSRETYDKELSARYNILLTFKANDLFINETIAISISYQTAYGIGSSLGSFRQLFYWILRTLIIIFVAGSKKENT